MRTPAGVKGMARIDPVDSTITRALDENLREHDQALQAKGDDEIELLHKMNMNELDQLQ